MNCEIDENLKRLRETVRSMKSVLIAYSGGVDSALVLAIAHEQLQGRAVGCIGVSPSFPQRERQAAMELAEPIGATWRLVHPEEHLDPRYIANDGNRCFHCKDALFSALSAIAAAEGFDAVADGVHLDDLADHAGGIRAAAARGVRSPLLDAKMNKQSVRAAARALGLSVWDKPAAPCLASRIPHGTHVTVGLLQQIESAEDVLAGLGFRQFRVRHHGPIARIELPASDMLRALENRATIVAGIRAAGYQYVTLDLAGFRSEKNVHLHEQVNSPHQLIDFSVRGKAHIASRL